jgi:hypothetical protein
MNLTINLSGNDSPVDDLDAIASSLDSLSALIAENPAFGGSGQGLAMNLMMHSELLRGLSQQLPRS